MGSEALDGGAVKLVQELAERAVGPRVVEFAGQQYLDRRVELGPPEPTIKTLGVSTLGSLVGWVKHQAESDGIPLSDLFVLVESGQRVSVRTVASGRHRVREIPVGAECMDEAGEVVERWLPPEDFLILIQSLCADNEESDKQKLVELLSSVRQEGGVQRDDDGVTQTVTTKRGVVLSGSERIPNPVKLAFHRTFPEIGPDPDPFVFRSRERGDRVEFAIFEHGRIRNEYEWRKACATFLESSFERLDLDVKVLW